jgi:hypothetical protein
MTWTCRRYFVRFEGDGCEFSRGFIAIVGLRAIHQLAAREDVGGERSGKSYRISGKNSKIMKSQWNIKRVGGITQTTIVR